MNWKRGCDVLVSGKRLSFFGFFEWKQSLIVENGFRSIGIFGDLPFPTADHPFHYLRFHRHSAIFRYNSDP